MIADLKQVVLYMKSHPDVRQKVLEIVTKKITLETRLVIGQLTWLCCRLRGPLPQAGERR